MKIICLVIIGLFCAFCLKLEAQDLKCFEGNIVPSTNEWNWTREKKKNDPAPFNQFTEVWNFKWLNNQLDIQDRDMLVPFIATGEPNLGTIHQSGSFQQALGKSDWFADKGWEIVLFDFGFKKSSQQTADPGVPNPMIVLYNKYTSLLRVLILKTQDFSGQSSGNKDAIIRLEYAPNSSANFLPSIFGMYESPVKPVDWILDNNNSSNLKQSDIALASANVSVGELPRWYFAEFPITYDPCVCYQSSNIAIKLYNTTNETYNLTLNGTITGNSIINNGSASVGSSSNIFSEIKDLVMGGIQLYSNFSASSTGLSSKIESSVGSSQEMEATKSAALNGLFEWNEQKSLDWMINQSPYIKTFISLVDLFIGKNNNIDETASSSTAASTINLKVNLGGTITGNRTSSIKQYPFKTPGSAVSSGSFEIPLYDNPLGTVSLLRTPRVKITSYTTGKIFSNSISGSGNSQKTNTFRASKHQIELLDPLEFVYNPKLVDPSKIKLQACLVIENVLNVEDTKEFLLPYSSGALSIPKPPTYAPFLTEVFSNVTSEGALQTNLRVRESDVVGNFVDHTISRKLPIYRTSYQDLNLIHHMKAKIASYMVDIEPSSGWLGTKFYDFMFEPHIYVKMIGTIGFRDDPSNLNSINYIVKYPVKIDSWIKNAEIVPQSFPSTVQDNPEYIVISNSTDLTTFPVNSLGEIVISAFSIVTIAGNLIPPTGFKIKVLAPEIIVNPDVVIDPNYVVLETSRYPIYIGEPAALYPSPLNIDAFCKGPIYNGNGRSISRLSVSSESGLLPSFSSGAFLGYPVPNPSNSKCQITFDLTEPSGYEMHISNAMGVNVMQLETRDFASSGKHSVNFSAEKLEAGVYYISFSSDGFRQARKLVVVK